jgi:hypothetical protein
VASIHEAIATAQKLARTHALASHPTGDS